MAEMVVVIPCFNEEKRLDREPIEAALQRAPELRILFVDDGSQDGTRKLLEALVAELGGGRADLLRLGQNVGKAEAVRQGIMRAVQRDPFAVGYWDADLSTPLDDVMSFAEYLHTHPETMAVIGSRIRLMGRHIKRKATRHYVGRGFATVASLVLGFPVYDTQCGAKLFRVTPELAEVFGTPFSSRWAFDVEILARLAAIFGRALGDAGVVVEYPLHRWSEVTGSKVRLADLPGMALDLLRVFRQYR